MTAMLKVVTADDEVLALSRLRTILKSLPDVLHLGEAASCEEAVRKVRELRPDILLLDIKMRDGTGFDVLDQLDSGPLPTVIFVTAFSHFAVRAFETAAVDYVLKPVTRTRLSEALDRARDHIAAADAGHQVADLRALVSSLRAELESQASSPYEREFWIRDSRGMVRVPVDAIQWVTSEDDYVRLHTPDGSHLMRSSIKQFASSVDPATFVRVHRTAMVRKSYIREVRRRRFGPAEIVLQNDECIPVGRVYAKRFRDAIGKHLEAKTPGGFAIVGAGAAGSGGLTQE
jgi:two-component system LytT family response regulator